MTDQQLAQNLRDAERDGDTDDIVYYENEIIVRLGLSLDDTEQGLTHAASDAIVQFCRTQGVS